MDFRVRGALTVGWQILGYRTLAKRSHERKEQMMRMRILSTEGLVEADLPNPEDRSKVGGHWSAVGRYTNTGYFDRLDDYDGAKVGPGIELETSTNVIDDWWFRGELDFIEVYVT